MKVSIIIAVKQWNDFLKECLEHCLLLTYQDYEILVFPDEAFVYADARVQVIPTGNKLPAAKRDMAITHAQGEILAFLDDDAYPQKDWLDQAVKNFSDPQVAAVGGPAVTPPHDEPMRKASGLVYESALVSGNFRYRYAPGTRQVVDDYPSCNLLVRKDIFAQLGGFKINYWPGEDTVLCLEITKKLDKKIIYDPNVLVFHHRRALFAGHLKQIRSYAFHRGYFVKKFPETSLRWQYFVPSIFVASILTLAFLSAYSHALAFFYLLGAFLYGSVVFLSAYKQARGGLLAPVALGIFCTHVWYGVFFLFGLMQNRLVEERTIS